MGNKILAIVVTYYPEKELLEKNILSFIDEVDKVLIWENTPQADRQVYRYIQHGKVDYCGDDTNSISHALNYAWRYAAYHCYDYLLTMDQDSVFEHFAAYRDAVVSMNGKEQCIVGPETTRVDLGKYDDFIPVPAIITSGMLVSVSLIERLDGFCEAFSVDAVDSELCVKAMSRGIHVYQHSKTFLQHRLGNTSDHHKNRPCLVRSYSPKRLYGIFRNHIILYRKYRDNAWLRDIIKAYFRIYFIGIILYDNHQKMKKTFSILKGVKDAMFFDIDTI